MNEAVLEIRSLSKRFGALAATDDVSLDLRAGEIHGLIGPNGAGKSTLVKQITGELAPDTGTIRFLGRDLGRLDVAARARLGLARTFQVSSVAPEFTVLQNVALALQGARGGSYRFWRAAMRDPSLIVPARAHVATAGLAGREAVPAAALSHGERRRLEIAMALALEPRVFLLDEPMAGLGAEGSDELGRLLRRLASDAPILLIEHDMDAVFALCDRISVLVLGRVIATGSVAAIRADPAVQAAYLGTDA